MDQKILASPGKSPFLKGVPVGRGIKHTQL